MKIFLRTNGYFFTLPVYQHLTQGREPKKSMRNPRASTRISAETWMKKLSRVFLEESEFQLLGISTSFVLLGVSSSLENSRAICSRRSIFEIDLSFSGPTETMTLNKTDSEKTENFNKRRSRTAIFSVKTAKK